MIRRHPGALEGEPHIELDGDDGMEALRRVVRAATGACRGPGSRRAAGVTAPSGEPTVDYSFDQRAEAGRVAFARGAVVVHPSLGEGRVVACDGAGGDAKVTVYFDEVGEKRVLARFLRPA